MTAAELAAGKVNFSLPWSATDKPLRFYAVANYAVTGQILSETALKALLDADCGEYNGSTADVFTKVKRAEGFAMSAVSEVQFSGGANSVTTVEMYLLRTVAKVAMRVRIDEAFSQRYGGAAIRITGVTVLNAEKSTTLIAPEAVGVGVRDFTFSQTPNIVGEESQLLFYLFENGERTADDHVTMQIEALFDADGNFSTAADQSVAEYSVKLNHAGNGVVKRNTYYRIDASLQSLDGHEIEATIHVADWGGLGYAGGNPRHLIHHDKGSALLSSPCLKSLTMRKLILIIIFGMAVGAASAQYSAVRVNGLGIATGTLNVGADVAVGTRWSVEGAVYWNPIKTGAFSSRFTAFSAGVRHWRFEPHVGAFLGIHNTTAFYDVGGRTHHYKGWMTGVGVSYGYSWMLATRWNLTTEFGLGCFYMKDKKQRYKIIDDEDIYIRHYRRIVVAPSRAEISVSYLF